MIHQFLKKQVQKHFGTIETLPANIFPLLQSISNCYYHYEKAKGIASNSSYQNSPQQLDEKSASFTQLIPIVTYHNTTNSTIQPIESPTMESTLQCEALLETSQRIAHIGSWQIDINNSGNLFDNPFTCSIETYRILGYAPNELGKSVTHFFSLVHEDDKENVIKAFQESENLKSNYYCEHRVLNKKGQIRYVTTRGEIKFDVTGKPWRILGTIQDTTEKKTAERVIQESNYRYQMVMKATRDVVWDWDIVKKTVFRSENYATMFECEAAEDNIYPELWVNHIHPDDRERVVQGVNAIVQQETTNLWEDEYRCIKGDGGIVYIQDRGYIIRDANHNAVRIIGAMRNITQRRLAEIENQKITQDLIEKNENLEQFAYIVSHNIRGPLTNIMGLVENIEFSTLDIKQYEFYKNGLTVSATRLDEVIVDLNNILRVKHELTESFTSVSFNEITNEVIAELKHTVDMTTINIKKMFQEIGSIFTLKSYLHSIFINLLSNSIKYKDPLRGLTIEIASSIEDKHIVLTFTDNALGIDLEKNKDKIFGLYKRFHFHTEGRGVGLFMVKKQVETLGGKINVKSEVGQGTTFTIKLPKSQEKLIEVTS